MSPLTLTSNQIKNITIRANDFSDAWLNVGASATTTAAINVYNTPTTGTITFDTIQLDWPITNHAQQITQKRIVKPPAGFNKYVNASDLLEEFIGFLGDEKVRQSEVMGLPIELFIKWLVIRACEEDGEEPNTILELPAPKSQPRCLGCQRFMRRGTEFPLHGRRCATHLFARTEILAGRLGHD
jgi:hypothetical protein